MEVNKKGGGWGGFNRMRVVGGLVGRRAVSRSSQKKLGVRGGGKNDKKIVPRNKENQIREKNLARKKRTKRKIKILTLGDSFILSMKSHNVIFGMVNWWVLGHSSQ
jgi:hypothetical protein